MKATDGLFLATAEEVAKEYPDIAFENVIVDNMCMQLVQKPELYDVLVLPNLYGDIVSDLCAGLVGGLGVAPGANIGEGVALFEPIHGSAPKYAGQNKVNPMAMMFSGVMMLRYLGEHGGGRPAGADPRRHHRRRQVRHLRSQAEARRPDGDRHLGRGRRNSAPPAGRANRRARAAGLRQPVSLTPRSPHPPHAHCHQRLFLG